MVAAWMLASGKFDSVSLNFLPVGHTHEDIDQFFGLVAGLLARTETFEDPPQVCQILKRGLSEHVKQKGEEFSVGLVTIIRDFKEWLLPYGVEPKNTFVTRDDPETEELQKESARSFTFKLGMDLCCAERALLPKGSGFRTTVTPRSVWVCVKGAMHHTHLLHAPLLLLPESLQSNVAGPLALNLRVGNNQRQTR